MRISKRNYFKAWCLAAVLGTAAVGTCAADLNRAPSLLNAPESQTVGGAVADVRPDSLPDKVFSVCKNMVPVDHPDFSLANEIASEQDTLLNGPKHGKLVLLPKGVYLYYPEEGYLGIDQMTFLVRYKDPASGKEIKEKVIYSVHVGKMAPEYGPCKDNDIKELPSSTTGGGNRSALDTLELPSGDSVDVESLTQLHSMIIFSMGSGIQGNSGLLKFADLSGRAVAQTVGEGVNATVTLDTTAGHSRYIDPTPLDNSKDHLPTSNPDVWQAKAGSAAVPFPYHPHLIHTRA